MSHASPISPSIQRSSAFVHPSSAARLRPSAPPTLWPFSPLGVPLSHTAVYGCTLMTWCRRCMLWDGPQ